VGEFGGRVWRGGESVEDYFGVGLGGGEEVGEEEDGVAGEIGSLGGRRRGRRWGRGQLELMEDERRRRTKRRKGQTHLRGSPFNLLGIEVDKKK